MRAPRAFAQRDSATPAAAGQRARASPLAPHDAARAPTMAAAGGGAPNVPAAFLDVFLLDNSRVACVRVFV